MPSMAHGDWELFGRRFFNYHKKMFGVKVQVAVAMQRRPVPIFASVAPAGTHDLAVARKRGGIFDQMRPGERALGDPGYLGEPDRIYAPPRSNMHSYVAEDDKAELTLQRRVEQANKIVKRFKTLGTVYRKGAVHAYDDISLIAPVVVRLVFWDLYLNQEHGGAIHTSGPKPDVIPWVDGEERSAANVARHEQRNVRAILRTRRATNKVSTTVRQRQVSQLKKVGVNMISRPLASTTRQSRRVVINRRNH